MENATSTKRRSLVLPPVERHAEVAGCLFCGLAVDAVAAILDVQGKQLDQAELDRLDELIRNARTEGK